MYYYLLGYAGYSSTGSLMLSHETCFTPTEFDSLLLLAVLQAAQEWIEEYCRKTQSQLESGRDEAMDVLDPQGWLNQWQGTEFPLIQTKKFYSRAGRILEEQHGFARIQPAVVRSLWEDPLDVWDDPFDIALETLLEERLDLTTWEACKETARRLAQEKKK